jgi:thiol:disulfide interchange protein
MSWETLVKRYRDLGEAARYHQDQAAETTRQQQRIVLDLYDKWHLSCREIAQGLGDVNAEQVEEMILAVST